MLLVAAAAAFWFSGLWRDLTFQSLQSHYAELLALVGSHPYLTYVSFVLVAAVATAACLPATSLAMVAGGALFGGWAGAGGAIMASTAGAVATYFAVRLAGEGRLKRWIDRNEGRLNQLVCQVDANPFICLLAMRLTPVIPFPAISIAAGAIHAPLRAFLPATLLGVAPAALLLGHLGAGVAGVLASGKPFEPQLLWSPQIIGPLAGFALAAGIAAVLAIRRRARRAV